MLLRANQGVSSRRLTLALGVLVVAVVAVLFGIRRIDAQGAATPVKVDSQVRITYTGLVLNRSTNTFDTVATLTNTGATPVLAPLSLVITSTTPESVQLANGTGIATGGLPYLDIPLAPGGFKPGTTLTPIVLKFKNPNRVTFIFTQSIFGVLSSGNHAPVADAGPDQTVVAGAIVQLDGTQSTDVDGNPLTYRWSFVSIPGGSQAVLANLTTINASFVADQPGTYTVQLIANDGQADSAPATVVISTQNSPPVANAGPNQLVASATTVQLDGTHSTDVDGDALTYRWSLAVVPTGSQAQLADPTTVTPSFFADKPGVYTVQLIVNDGQVDSAPANIMISTQSAPPVANAGPDQTVVVGANVQLDGSKSVAANGGPLTYRWALITLAPGSIASLVNPTKVNPSYVIDKAGLYVVQLIVNDGLVDSAPTTVVIKTGNSRPVADAGPNQSAHVGQTVTLEGTGSHDADNDVLSFDWSLLAKPTSSSAVLSGADQSKASFIPDRPGLFIAQLIVSDGQSDSHPVTTTVTITVAPPNNDPQITSTPVTTGQQGVAYSYQVTASDPDGDPLSYVLAVSPQDMTISGTGLIGWTPSGSGTFAVGITVTDGRGGSATQSYNIVVSATQVTVPNVVGLTQAAATTAITSANLTLGTVTQQTSDTVPAGNVISQDPAAGASVTPSSPINLAVSLGSSGLPPDPATVAPPLDQTVATSMSTATSFLYTGANPIQTGVASGTIDRKRVGVLRGKVMTRDGAPLSAVQITILNHAEFGETLSRADGMFDMAANGGGQLTVRYEKAGYLLAQRHVPAAWQEYTLLPDVVLIPLDGQATTIDLSAATSVQVARGTPVTDSAGTRQATLLFREGTTATMEMADGSVQPLTRLSIRATEYTVGANGPKAMPAVLPPSSGYTYAVEFTTDEAIAAGATAVHFSQPLIHYVENFLNFPVGGLVPVGFYDRDRGVWVPSANGRVVKIVSITSGMANLDSDGDGIADNGAALGITDAERQQLATLYAAGQSLWRVSIPHFSPWDCNWPAGPPPDATGPTQSPDPGDPPIDQPCQQGGASTVGCQTQVLGEAVSVIGTRARLHYGSDRVPSRRAAYTLNIPLSGASVPASLKRIDLEILAAGRSFTDTFPAAPNQHATFTWDGQDVYGRTPQGAQVAVVRIGYVYDGVYQQPASLAQSFAAFSGVPIVANRTRQEIILIQELRTTVGVWDARGLGLGGWTLSMHHAYDPNSRVLYRGDGGKRSPESLGQAIITTEAGGAPCCELGDGGKATLANLEQPHDVAVGADGSLVIADSGNGLIRRVGPTGIITSVVGQGDAGVPQGAAIGADGSFFFADSIGDSVRRSGPSGGVTTVAGTGVSGFSGDGGPATQATLNIPRSVAVGPDGSLYIADTGNHRVRRVAPDGIITTVAGTGVACSAFAPCGDGGPAVQAGLDLRPAGGLAVAADGTLYIADTNRNRIRRVGSNGIITTVAGNVLFCRPTELCGDGGLAVQASLFSPSAVAVGTGGSLFIADTASGRVRRVGPDGIITTVAGTGVAGFDGDGGPATRALLRTPTGVAVGPDGSLHISDRDNNRVRRVSPPLPGLSVSDLVVAADDGSELYIFNGQGRHLQTLNALTGTVRFRFAYDGAGRLVSVTDRDGNVTTVERDAAGQPTAIVAPFGQRTNLAVNGSGYLASMTNLANDSVQVAYTGIGLLTALTDPRGNVSRYEYDSLGRLSRTQDSASGVKTLSRTSIDNGHVVTLTTALGRTTTYQVEHLPNGDQRRLSMFPDGTQTELVIRPDATRATRLTDGTVTTLVLGPDPRFGMQAPVPSMFTFTTPAGLSSISTTQRSATLTNPDDLLSLQSLTEIVDVNGRKFTRLYSGSTRILTDTTPEGRARTITLDAVGRVTREQFTGLLPVIYGYEPRGRLAAVTRGTGSDARTTTLTYNADGYPDAITDPLGRTARFAYDAAGRVTGQTRADGQVISFSYDHKGNITTITPPGRPAHAFAYTAVDLRSAYVPPNVGAGTNQTLYEYNVDRQLTRLTRPDSQSVGMDYDSGGRLGDVTFSRGALGFGYDAATGHLNSITAPGAISLAYEYDGTLLGGTRWTGAITGNVGRTYDGGFRMISQSVNGGNTVAFSYDLDSLLSQAGSLTLARNAQSGLLTGATLGNVTDAWGYNGFGEPVSYSSSFNGSTLYSVQYARDALGRIANGTETIGAVTQAFLHTYDLTGRLTEVRRNGTITAGYAYDSNGNRLSGPGLSTPPTYDDQDRLTRYGTRTYTYTANGELLSKTSGNQTTTYLYDELGNLVQVTMPTGVVIRYEIDGRNRRIGKRINGTLVQAFLYADRLKPLAELDGSSNIVSRFVYDGRANVPAYMIKGGSIYRIITDHLGSPRLVVDAATGQVLQRLDYDEFGNVMSDTNPGFQPFGFAGGLHDPATGLVRFGARDYDPEVGRWTAQDPARFAGGDTNQYVYGRGDPVNLVDPSGRNPILVGIWVVGVVFAASGIASDSQDVSTLQVLGLGVALATGFRGPGGAGVPGGPAAGAGATCDPLANTIPNAVGAFADTAVDPLGTTLVDVAGAQTAEQIYQQYVEFVLNEVAANGGSVSGEVMAEINKQWLLRGGVPIDALLP